MLCARCCHYSGDAWRSPPAATRPGKLCDALDACYPLWHEKFGGGGSPGTSAPSSWRDKASRVILTQGVAAVGLPVVLCSIVHLRVWTACGDVAVGVKRQGQAPAHGEQLRRYVVHPRHSPCPRRDKTPATNFTCREQLHRWLAREPLNGTVAGQRSVERDVHS